MFLYTLATGCVCVQVSEDREKEATSVKEKLAKQKTKLDTTRQQLTDKVTPQTFPRWLNKCFHTILIPIVAIQCLILFRFFLS